MGNENFKIKICEMRESLHNLIASEGLHSDQILKVSTELDKLIADFYLEGTEITRKE